MRFVLLTVTYVLAAPLAFGQNLTRQQAVTALLDSGSGINLDTNSAVWSPYVDFGAGAGNEGLLAAGSTVLPRYPTADPYPATTVPVDRDAYIFWIDDAPAAFFVHPTRFVLLDATNATPTVANGGIVFSPQGWWPVIVSGGTTNAYFSILSQRSSDAPSGHDNPEGHLAGPVTDPDDIVTSSWEASKFGPKAAAGGPYSNACGLVLMGGEAGENAFEENRDRSRSDLINHYGIPSNRVIMANGGNTASFDDFKEAVSNVCALVPPCDKVFIRLNAHGGTGSLYLKDRLVFESEICRELRNFSTKRIPVCLFIGACHSGSWLTAEKWDLWPGSSIIASAYPTNFSYGGAFEEGTGGLAEMAFSNCLNTDPATAPGIDRNGDGIVDDCEAHRWILKKKPCFTWPPTGEMWYPAGAPPGVTPKNPVSGMPKQVVGPHPFAVTFNAWNNTAYDKTDFHVVLAGAVTNLPVRSSYKSDGSGQAGAPFDTNGDVTYDPVTDETHVDFFTLETFIPNGESIQVRLVEPDGGLKVLRHYWTPTNSPSFRGTWTPSGVGERGTWFDDWTVDGDGGTAVYPVGTNTVHTNFYMRFNARSATTNGPSGWGEALGVESKLYFPTNQVAPEDLKPQSPALTNAPSSYFGFHDVFPGKPLYLAMDRPPPGTMTIVIESAIFWGENGNFTHTFQQFGWEPRLTVENMYDYAVIRYPRWARRMTLERNSGSLPGDGWNEVTDAFEFVTPEEVEQYVPAHYDGSEVFRLRER